MFLQTQTHLHFLPTACDSDITELLSACITWISEATGDGELTVR